VEHPLVQQGVNIVKLFTTVIYCHFIATQSFCVIKTILQLQLLLNGSKLLLYYYNTEGDYYKYCNIKYRGNLPWYFNPRKSRNCSKLLRYFITLTPEVCLINIKLMLFRRKHASLLPLKQGLPQVNKFYCQGLKKVANSGKKFSDFHLKVQGTILKTINELLFKLKK